MKNLLCILIWYYEKFFLLRKIKMTRGEIGHHGASVNDINAAVCSYDR